MMTKNLAISFRSSWENSYVFNNDLLLYVAINLGHPVCDDKIQCTTAITDLK